MISEPLVVFQFLKHEGSYLQTSASAKETLKKVFTEIKDLLDKNFSNQIREIK